MAVAEGSNAVARLRSVPSGTIVEPRVLSGFQLLFDRFDHRIADVIEDGVERGAYPGAAKFDASPDQFERVFNDGAVSVYRVR